VSTSYIFERIDALYATAPRDLGEADRVRWVQREADIPCPECGEPLWVTRAARSRNRGFGHLVLCQNPACSFQADD
jgi:predicted RNA-binding Zn-ribbon protein involved in translation (DUF1610 family)